MVKKLGILGAILILVAAYFIFDLGQFLNFQYLKSQQTRFEVYYAENKFWTTIIYMGLYVIMAMLSLPGATIMTLVGGALFGLVKGTIIVSIASTIGATMAMVNCRYFFRNAFQKKLKPIMKSVNRGVEKEGALYLFMSRLSPIFPFFLVNIAFAKTYISVISFALTSQIGMLPGTLVYVNAGSQLGKLQSMEGILSPNVLMAFGLLGLAPLLFKKIVDFIKNRKAPSFKKPNKYDYNIVVIGAGSGGLVSAYIASAIKAKVAVIEKNKMGGDCLNTGCVPSKALLQSAKMLNYAKRAKEWGFNSTKVDFDFAMIMERIQSIIRKIEPHDSIERYKGLGVDVYEGRAEILDPYRIKVNGKILTTKNIILATGARPLLPQIPGIKKINPLTSDSLWNIRVLPRRLVVVGGGPIGCELSQAFIRFGSQVTLIEGMNHLLLREDQEVGKLIKEKFEAEGMTVLTGHKVETFEEYEGVKIINCLHNGKKVRVEGDEVLIALGRKANVSGFGLEELGIKIRGNGTVDVDEFLRTNIKNIYAVGDVTGPYQFTHFAAHQAWYASVNSLFSPLKKFKADYRVIPWTTFTDPEVSRVGLNEIEAKNLGIKYEVTRYSMKDLDRAITDGETSGFIKVLTPQGKDKILGVTIVGTHSGEILAEFITAMKFGLGLNKILSTIHAYPTFGEANKYVAGNWKKTHAPIKVLSLLRRYHKWRRRS